VAPSRVMLWMVLSAQPVERVGPPPPLCIAPKQVFAVLPKPKKVSGPVPMVEVMMPLGVVNEPIRCATAETA
jgi:hypothetical protein